MDTAEAKNVFEARCRAAMPKLRGVVRRMVGDATQTDDLVQESLARAWAARDTFDDRAAFSTWLCRIGVNAAIDFLRGQGRWRERAQVAYANECTTTMELAGEVGGVLFAPDFQYEAREHIAFCFVCVGRSLEPEEQAALVLREVEGLTNLEAARQLGISEPVLRHRLSQARGRMEQAYEGLCALVSKTGVCYQCSGLRDTVPDCARRGEAPPALTSLEARLRVVRDSDVDVGASQRLHDLFWRRLAQQEREGRGSTEPLPECAPEPSAGGA